jgi:transcriptional regulator with XRE-family HTH domain
MNLPREFGRILRQARLERDLSQEKLALDSGLDRTFVSMLERGLRQPTLGTLFSLARTLKMNPSEIVARLERRNRRRKKIFLGG